VGAGAGAVAGATAGAHALRIAPALVRPAAFKKSRRVIFESDIFSS
jgi:hypothetical protein